MMDLNVMDILILLVKCAVVFILSAAGFDVVHYVLHRWEKSRFALLRWLGSLHAVHHDFLDRQMLIQRQYSARNLIMHVIPEYLTAVVGIILFGFVLGWLPSLIVLSIRTVMVVIYLLQKGEDITHKSMKRINANRSLFFVGPHYHALHHVFVNQHYSSFFNVFDLIFGTNCQVAERKFLVMNAHEDYTTAMVAALKERGGRVETIKSSEAYGESLKDKLQQAEVIVITGTAPETSSEMIDLYMEIGRQRLLPPEVWTVGGNTKSKEYYSSQDVTYRNLIASGVLSAQTATKISLFFITRGFCRLPMI